MRTYCYTEILHNWGRDLGLSKAYLVLNWVSRKNLKQHGNMDH